MKNKSNLRKIAIKFLLVLNIGKILADKTFGMKRIVLILCTPSCSYIEEFDISKINFSKVC